jgi:hypothetical protein
MRGYVRFTPESGHVRCNSVCPLSANSGHRTHKKKDRLAPVSPKSELRQFDQAAANVALDSYG